MRILTNICHNIITLSLLENDCDVSAYSRGRCFNYRARNMFFSRVRLMHNRCVLKRISFGGAQVVLGLRQSIITFAKKMLCQTAKSLFEVMFN